MAKRPFRGEIARNILKGIAVTAAASGGVLLLAAMPGLTLVLREILQGYDTLHSKERHRVRKTYEALRRARLVSVRQLANGKVAITLTVAGKKKLLEYRFEDIAIAKPKMWDRKWRIVIFDLPKRYGRIRDLWRGKLKALGFVQLQRSVWVYPYPCCDEVDFVGEYCGISPYVRLLEVSAFDGSEAYEKMFVLS